MEVNKEAIAWLERRTNTEWQSFIDNILYELPGSASLAGVANDEDHLTKYDYPDINFKWLYG